jgi:hypothetical protein
MGQGVSARPAMWAISTSAAAAIHGRRYGSADELTAKTTANKAIPTVSQVT